MQEAMSNSQNEKESLAASVEEAESLDLYKQYVTELKLSSEDMAKKILDVGADFGHFAEVAKKKGYNDVWSIDIEHPADRYDIDTDAGLGAGKITVADAFQLPFKDKTFDLAVSFCAMPNVVKGLNPIDYSKEVKKVFQEMLRVVKIGGEARFGRVVSEFRRDDPLQRGVEIRKVLRWFDKSRNFQTSVEITGNTLIDERPSHLVRIKKLS